MQNYKNEDWWTKQGSILAELHDRAEIVYSIRVSNFNNNNIESYFNYYEGRFTIETILKDLHDLIKFFYKKDVVNNIYKHYIFKFPRLSPYYKKNNYPYFNFFNMKKRNKLEYFEKDFINNFYIDFINFLNKLEKEMIIDLAPYELKTRIFSRIKSFKNRLEIMNKNIQPV